MMKKKGFTGNGFGSSSSSGDLLGSLLLDQYSSSPLPLLLMIMKQKKKKKAYKASEDDEGADGCFRFSVCRHIGSALLEELFGLSLMCEGEEGGKKMKQPEKKNISSGGGRGKGVSIKEDEESKTVKVDMPGLGKENVKIRVVNSTLLIEGDDGQKETDDENENENGMKKHLKWGMYLPDDVYKAEELKAVMKNGVLTVVVPKLKVEEMKDVIHVQVED